ncbi:hypothetical protein MKEN_00314900 [Mycena kentingensis (nom. inval.)]|nr:hypothetical protein MKEN_00314900 [Mycena kentingensis (nom. inval.)]
MLLLSALARVSGASHFLSDRADSNACDNIHNCRLPFDIIWGCLTTIFACTWVSVHPNVPPRRAPRPADGASSRERIWWSVYGYLSSFWHRFKLMLVAVIAPELMFGFAGRQFLAARMFSKELDVSLTHGFFMSMGGFTDQRGHPLVRLVQIYRPGNLDAIRSVSEETIADKSKGDAFSKGVAFCQTWWFVTQCIARTAQRLPLTGLEVATLAFAVVNASLWLLWWHKPLDVQEPIAVGPPLDGPLAINLAHWQPPMRDWRTRLLVLLGASYDTEEYDPDVEKAVPTFWYASQSDELPDGSIKVMAGGFLVGSVFGAIHCAAWAAYFPSLAEQALWRSTSVLVATLPLLIMGIMFAGSALSDIEHTRRLDGKLEAVKAAGMFIVLAASAVYFVARMALLAVTFTTLRELPRGVFVDVDWSRYIPHL